MARHTNSEKPCLACPFNDGWTEEATRVQNLGCLPTSGEMLTHFDKTGKAMTCHDTDKPCRGLCAERPAAALAETTINR